MEKSNEVMEQIDVVLGFLSTIKEYAQSLSGKEEIKKEICGIKRFESFSDNYVVFGNQHIFIDFYDRNLEDIENIGGKQNQNIHVFVSSSHKSIRPFVKLVRDYDEKFRITIHQYKGNTKIGKFDINLALSGILESSGKKSYKYTYAIDNRRVLFKNKNKDSMYVEYSPDKICILGVIKEKRY